ncbi:hypothetical protein GJ496_001676 [Pomphorhynchus laevis]|nr:hypothetical protein GJ496_001676 [Pomphorhynchus laevis]
MWSVVNYSLSVLLLSGSLSYAAVPLYRIFCERLGFEGAVGGRDKLKHSHENLMNKLKTKIPRKITVRFTAKHSSALDWEFVPEQPYMDVDIGEAALCFYKAKNLSDTPLIGIASYNIVPFDAAPFFNKVQCFCFEDQMLGPKEEVEMPLFFYIDHEYDLNPRLKDVNTINLNYTFFKSGENIPVEEKLAKRAFDDYQQNK